MALAFVVVAQGSYAEPISDDDAFDSQANNDVKVPTKESLLKAMIRYRDSLKNKVAGKQSLDMVNEATKEYNDENEKFSTSISGIVDKFVAAAKTLESKMENCTKIKTDNVKEAITSITQAVDQAGYEYKKELNKLSDEGLDAITEQKRKAKTVERSAVTFQKNVENGFLMDKVNNGAIEQIKSIISNEQVDLQSLKTSAKSILNNLTYFLEHIKTLNTSTDIQNKLKKYTDLVKNHVSYLESLKDDFVKTEKSRASEISSLVNKINSRTESTFGYQQQIAKENKNDYKLKQAMTADE